MLAFSSGTRLRPRSLRLHLCNQVAGNVSVRIAGNALSLVFQLRFKPCVGPMVSSVWLAAGVLRDGASRLFRGRGPRQFSHARRSDALQPLCNMPLCAGLLEGGRSSRYAAHSCSTISFGASPTILLHDARQSRSAQECQKSFAARTFSRGQ
jgi:hypothetical protein